MITSVSLILQCPNNETIAITQWGPGLWNMFLSDHTASEASEVVTASQW
jgi:hypothetical protein